MKIPQRRVLFWRGYHQVGFSVMRRRHGRTRCVLDGEITPAHVLCALGGGGALMLSYWRDIVEILSGARGLPWPVMIPQSVLRWMVQGL